VKQARSIVLIFVTFMATHQIEAGAGQSPPPLSRDGAMAICLRMTQRGFACREEVADAYVVNVDAAQKESHRRVALARIVGDTFDPRKSCEQTLDRERKRYSDVVLRQIDGCAGSAGCKDFAGCLVPILSAGRSKKR
jgi:hypothetical protein